MSTPASSDVDTRPYLLERVDEAAVVQLYADGFTALPLREKILIYHLYRAALAGRDIYYDQRYAHNLAMRDVLEEIVTHPDGIAQETFDEIQRYTKLFWINTGPYNNLTARKFVLKCSPEAFTAAAGIAERNGARIPADLASLHPYFFDLTVDPIEATNLWNAVRPELRNRLVERLEETRRDCVPARNSSWRYATRRAG